MLKIKKIVERELTKGEMDTIKCFRSNSDGVCFACLRENVIVMVESDGEPDVKQCAKEVRACMKRTLSSHGDTEMIETDDDYRMLLMTSSANEKSLMVALTLQPCGDERKLATMHRLRAQCLEACESREIVAVVWEDSKGRIGLEEIEVEVSDVDIEEE